MTFKFTMVDYLGNYLEKNVIANNEQEATKCMQIFNPQTKGLDATLVYKNFLS